MTEHRLFPAGTVPECATPEWYAGRDHAPHVDQAAHRPRLEVAAEMVRAIATSNGYSTVVDLGAGDGGLLSLLAGDGLRMHGYDLQPSNIIAAGRRGVNIGNVDVVAALADDDPFLELGDIAVCTEMLEHLVDPHTFLANLARRPEVRALVASSPWTETPGNAYEFHLWAWDQAGYIELLRSTGWRVIDSMPIGDFHVVAAFSYQATA